MGKYLSVIALAGVLALSSCSDLSRHSTVSSLLGIPMKVSGGRSMQFLTSARDLFNTNIRWRYSNPDDGIYRRDVERTNNGKVSTITINEYDQNNSLKRTVVSTLYMSEEGNTHEVEIEDDKGRREIQDHLPKGLSAKIHATPDVRRR